MQGGSRTRANILETASLWALLPNFEGYDESVNHHDFVEVYHQGRRMTVPQIVIKNNARNKLSVLGGRHQGGNYDEIRYGLEYYHSDFNHQDFVYLYREKNIPKVYIRCPEDLRIPFPGCQLLWDYNDEVAVQASFSIKYLPQWREIRLNIQKLLDREIDCCLPESKKITTSKSNK